MTEDRDHAQPKTERVASLTSRLKNLFADRRGNFSIMFTLLLVPLLLSVGASLDFVRAYNVQTKMQDDLDSALLSAVGSMDQFSEDALKLEIIKTFNAQTNLKGQYKLTATDINVDAAASGIVARVTTNVDTSFMILAGIHTLPVTATSTVQGGQDEVKTSLSMYLVLDRSGSMGENTNTQYQGTCYDRRGVAYACTKYFTKIDSLKMAVTDLLKQLGTADPTNEYVRTGSVSYNSAMQTPLALNWGETAVKTYVDALTATGGTDSSLAFRTAYEALNATSEDTAHMQKNGQVPSKYIVFMTDGDNNATSSDVLTKVWCDKARRNKIDVFTIAFMAPARGQALLQYCATTAGHYFPAENTADLVAAFTKIGKTAAKKLVRLTN